MEERVNVTNHLLLNHIKKPSIVKNKEQTMKIRYTMIFTVLLFILNPAKLYASIAIKIRDIPPKITTITLSTFNI